MYAIETKLVLFKLGCYKFSMFIAIPKVTTKKITKTHTQKEIRRKSKWYTTKSKKHTNEYLECSELCPTQIHILKP